MKNKLMISLFCLAFTARVCASVTERLEAASNKTAEIKKNISLGKLSSKCGCKGGGGGNDCGDCGNNGGNK